MPNEIKPVPIGIVVDKTNAIKPDTNNIKAFPSDSPYNNRPSQGGQGHNSAGHNEGNSCHR